MNAKRRSLARPLLTVAVVLGLMMLTSVAGTNPRSGSAPSTNAHSNGGFLPGLLTVRPASAQVAPTSRSFLIMIMAKGFDDNASIVVNQGDKVSITFMMDQSQRSITGPSNHHVIAIDGYSVQTADINPTHPNATVRLTATQPGTFYIYCETDECPVHVLMVSGQLEVDKPSASTSASTSTSAAQSTSASTSSASSTASVTTTQTAVTTSVATSSSTSATVTTQSQSASQTVTVTETGTGSGIMDLNSFASWLIVFLALSFLIGALVTSVRGPTGEAFRLGLV